MPQTYACVCACECARDCTFAFFLNRSCANERLLYINRDAIQLRTSCFRDCFAWLLESVEIAKLVRVVRDANASEGNKISRMSQVSD
jgi:hypothetical protein